LRFVSTAAQAEARQVGGNKAVSYFVHDGTG
jgi:hypothetical protein